MDSLKTLMDKKSYELVIKLTENSNDAISLIYRISAFIAVGQYDEGLNVIKTKRLILQKQLALLIKIHIDILCILGRFEEAYEELKYYEDLPYESQEVEELLKGMPAYIRNEERQAIRPAVDEDKLMQYLLSRNDDEVLAALDEIKNLPLNNFLMPILKIISSHHRQIIRSFGLLLLVNHKYDKEVSFLHFDKMIKVVPASLKQPFNVPGFKNFEDVSFSFQSFYHDPSIATNAINLISSYLLYIYPRPLDLSKDETIVVFGYLSKKLMKIDVNDLSSACEKLNLDISKVENKMKEIEEDLNNF